MYPFQKNKPDWNKKEIIDEIDKFYSIYTGRPIMTNQGGMQFPHMFAFYFILKKINPDFVIESGIFKGQSSWLIEKTLPNSEILSMSTSSRAP